MAAVSMPGTASATPVAPAAATAYLTKEQILTAYPNIDMDVSCAERRIYLASGYYDWGHTREEVGDIVIRPNVYLGAGWYTWETCLYPFEDYYSQWTELDPDNSDWVSIRINSEVRLPRSGLWTWGSFLDPRF
jgi:hypothetical protein